VVVSGTFSIDSYSIVFRIGEDVFHSAMIPYKGAVIAPEAPVREGYTFTGWGEVPAEMPAEALEFKGEYVINSYKVVFKLDGNVIAENTLEYGAEIAVPEVAEKVGHSFSGFGIVPATMPASDLEFSGVYEVNSYSLIFKLNDNVVYLAQLPYGSEIVAPETPSAEGFTFSGWSEYPSTMPAEDVVVTGTFNVNVYKAVFSIDGEVVATLEVPYGEAVKAPEAEEKEGYTFSGWSEYPETMPAHDIEVSGSYAVNVYKAVFSIDGEVVSTLEVPFGEAVKAPEVPVKEGYTFSGWDGLPETMPAHDIAVSGNYEVNYYRLVVYINGEVYMEENIAYGDAVVVPDPEVEDDMKFDGWQEEIPATMPAHDVEIHGTVSQAPTVYVNGIYVGESVTVYTVDGVLVYKNMKTSDIKERLTPGVYIINGKKMAIR
ncbi:MAG: InlB B-repeat-containing protein, partial [Muribaculaceae bacterium]|nr:InlB B-repeat-containing protein [Muribaculaceae bacterium]